MCIFVCAQSACNFNYDNCTWRSHVANSVAAIKRSRHVTIINNWMNSRCNYNYNEMWLAMLWKESMAPIRLERDFQFCIEIVLSPLLRIWFGRETAKTENHCLKPIKIFPFSPSRSVTKPKSLFSQIVIDTKIQFNFIALHFWSEFMKISSSLRWRNVKRHARATA